MKDVIFTFERTFAPGGDPGLAGPFLSVIDGAEEFAAGKATRIKGITALSERNLRIHLKRPDAHFLWALAMTPAAVVPRPSSWPWAKPSSPAIPSAAGRSGWRRAPTRR
jgi:peptide/nickel transport system substrate-binding protein/oligopeptide transport system substrate-binding protein